MLTPAVGSFQSLPSGGAPIWAWTKGVPVDEAVLRQLQNVARLPLIHHHVAAMPDVHWGIGATVGSVIPCRGAVVPAAVVTGISCGVPRSRLPVQLCLTMNALAATASAAGF